MNHPFSYIALHFASTQVSIKVANPRIMRLPKPAASYLLPPGGAYFHDLKPSSEGFVGGGSKAL